MSNILNDLITSSFIVYELAIHNAMNVHNEVTESALRCVHMVNDLTYSLITHSE